MAINFATIDVFVAKYLITVYYIIFLNI